MKFMSVHDAAFYMEGSYVLINGEYWYLTNEKNKSLEFTNTKNKRLLIEYKKLKPETPKLGYILQDRRLLFLEKRPAVQWRIGLTRRNVRNVRDPDWRLNERTVTALQKVIKKGYPSLKVASRAAAILDLMVPFDYEWAVDQLGFISYRNRLVGKLKGGRIKLTKKYSYLKELADTLQNKEAHKHD